MLRTVALLIMLSAGSAAAHSFFPPLITPNSTVERGHGKGGGWIDAKPTDMWGGKKPGGGK